MPKRPATHDAPAFGARLQALLSSLGQPRRGAGAYLARKYNVANVTANAWLNGEYKPDIPTSKKIADDHGVSFDSLYFGEGEIAPPPSVSRIAETETDSDYVHFPLVEGFVAAGAEGYMPDYPEVVKDLKVSREWVERNLPAKPANIRVLTVQGDSMSPEINSGDVLFIDVSVTHFVTNAIYVMNYAGRPMVKRLQARRDGSVLIKSTNESYDPETVPANEVHELYVSGRVIGVWKFSRA